MPFFLFWTIFELKPQQSGRSWSMSSPEMPLSRASSIIIKHSMECAGLSGICFTRKTFQMPRQYSWCKMNEKRIYFLTINSAQQRGNKYKRWRVYIYSSVDLIWSWRTTIYICGNNFAQNTPLFWWNHTAWMKHHSSGISQGISKKWISL